MRRRITTFLGDLSTTQGKLKLLVLITGFLLIVVGLAAGTVTATSTPKFCSSCHEMTPEFVTWQASTHTEASCIQCHVEPGLMNLVKDKTHALLQVYQHVTKTYPDQIEVIKPVANEACERCHNKEKLPDQAGELKIPHGGHLEEGINCVDCHSGIAHGNIAKKGLNKGGYAAWTLEKAVSEMTNKNVGPSMATCTSCHEKKKVANDCQTCHTSNLAMPQNHENKTWKTSHGQDAESNFTGCVSCHAPGADNKPISEVLQLARGAEFCNKCHAERPQGHTKNWVMDHPVKAVTDKESCLVCHDVKEPSADSVATSTFCNMCHQFNS